MSERDRRRAFSLAVAVVALAVGLLWVLGPNQDVDGGPETSTTEKLVLSGDDPESDAGDAGPSESRSSPPQAAHTPADGPDDHLHEPEDALSAPGALERPGRKFLDAYLRYEVGDSTGDVRQALRASATPALSRFLMREPPRPPAEGEVPDRATVERIRAIGGLPQDPGRRALIATLEREGAISSVEIELERLGEKWLVASVG